MSFSPSTGGVWVWVEHYQGKLAQVSLSLLSKARELCHAMGGRGVGSVLAGGSPKTAAELIEYGSDTVYLADEPHFSLFDTESCAHFMAGLIKRHQPEIVLWGATSLGSEIASRVAAELGTGLTAHCIDLHIGEINGSRQMVTVVPGWGGNLTVSIICPERRPQMATAKPGVFSLPERKKRSGGIIPVKFESGSSLLEIVEVVAEKNEAAALEQAKIVVAGGWGLNAVGGFQEAEELARLLGASVAGTRPAADAGWIPAERMIGQSGKTIAPQLLITLGVSGAAQFSASVTGSGYIMAVDKDPEAPIFEMADIGIVGDLQEVLPKLISKITKVKGKD